MTAIKTNIYTIGVDGGGSKTKAVMLNQDYQVLGEGESGSSNYHYIGLEKTQDNLLTAMNMACQTAKVKLSQVSAITWALAGVDRPTERLLFTELGSKLLNGVPVHVVNDALSALVGGLSTRQGIVLIAGTGMIAYGENTTGKIARAGGWGPLLDQGSGYNMAQKALQAVAQASDQGNIPTKLTDKILAQLNLSQASHLVSWLYAPERQIAEIAALAPLVLNEAENGDLVAIEIVAECALALAEAVSAVVKQLNIRKQVYPLVLTGSLLNKNHFYQQLVGQTIHSQSPFVQIMPPQATAAVGAALLAFEALGHTLPDKKCQPLPFIDGWASEQRNLLTYNLDIYPVLTLAGLMHIQDTQAVASVKTCLPLIAKSIEAIAERMKKGGRLIYVGAGTSGRLGILDASECPPTFNASPKQVLGLIAGGKTATTRAFEGAEDNAAHGADDINKLKIGPLDSVVGIAASGRTPYVKGALDSAKAQGALTIALTCNLPARITKNADYVIAPLVGPEALTGSTRLKAGTAQKLILNMLSTGVMVRLGKTYSNLMVDMKQSNVKLQARAIRIVAQACAIDEKQATEVLAQCRGDVKLAIVSTLGKCSPSEAKNRLDKAKGVVRKALDNEELKIKN